MPVDSKGRFTSEVTDYVGQQVFDEHDPLGGTQRVVRIDDLHAGEGG